LDQLEPQKPRWKKLVLMCAISLALTAAAMPFDKRTAEAVQSLHIPPSIMNSFAVTSIKGMGTYWFTIAIAFAVAWRFRWQWRPPLFILLTGLVCLLGNIIKWISGRTRPFKLEPTTREAFPFTLQPFRNGLEGLFSQKNLAFPSGHTMVAFSTAAALAILWPRWRLLFYAAAALVAAERVLENAHWLSDVVGAAGLAICGVHLMWMMTSRHLRPINHE
jgi:membrane-associated phospholipid phosphatase